MHEYFAFAAQHWPLVAALGVVLALIVADELQRRIKGTRELEPAAAVQVVNRGALIVDCRDPDAFRSGHIVGARNIPLAELGDRVGELKRKRDKPLLAVAASDREANRAATILRQAGFESVFLIKRGLAAWRKDNLPLEQDSHRT